MSIIEQYQATRPNSWEQIWEGDYESESIVPGRFIPIPNIEIPFLLSERLIVIAVSSTTAKPHWTYAGNLIQQHVLSDISTRPIDGHSVICRLNSIKLELMDDFTADYRLLYQVPKWLQDISIAIWRYIGPVTSPLLTEIESAVSEIEQNQLKIDNFRTYVTNELNTHTTKLNTLQASANAIKTDTETIISSQPSSGGNRPRP